LTMNILAFDPGRVRLDYSLFRDAERKPIITGHVPEPDMTADPADAVADAVGSALNYGEIGLCVVRVVFGGEAFKTCAIADWLVLERLHEMIPQSPLHLPRAIETVRAVMRCRPEIPVVLDFETAFFAGLPERETVYAIDPGLSAALRLRRYGYHGIYHRAACHEAAHKAANREAPASPLRILSICLEPKPEVAAVVGIRPVYVTSGSTPLEGLPGRTSCGDLDPSLPGLLMRRELGPERVDELLTKESGLSALAGRMTDLDEILTVDDPSLNAARDYFLYRLLQACGAGAAAMGGLDGVALSGRYRKAAGQIREWVVSSFAERFLSGKLRYGVTMLEASRDRIMADDAMGTAPQILARIKDAAPVP